MARFGSVLTAMATPFADDLSLDVDGAVTLARWLADNGSDGLVIAGTTGESPTLTVPEHLELARAVCEAVTVPVLVGTGSNDTAHAAEMTATVTGFGAAGILLVAPYYNRPSQAGLEAHFTALAAATELPVMLYDIPVRTGRKVATETLVRLARDVPNIVAVKDAAGSPAESARLVAAAGDGFELYSGDDNQTLPLLAVGAVGVVSVAAHWAGPVFADMVSAFECGDHAAARAANAALFDSCAFESSDDAPNPVPTKCMLRVLGLPGGPPRPPMGPEPDGLEDRARRVLAGLRESGALPAGAPEVAT
ncbi:MAG TPA: 4-hydroxy-tetrahydrodipicolinate synthase [Acidimicrobiales bacterium]|nr:4-hydroxy-tetrahydrodipicolinate synthase [Acidimicrobiales bacterium]